MADGMPGAESPLAKIAGAQRMPGDIAGGPAGPGSTPAMTPGAGAGNEAAADAIVKAVIPALHKALSAYPIGDKKYTSLLNAIRALTSNFGKEQQGSLVPSAILQMAQAAKSGTPMSNAPPPGLAAAAPGGPPPPMPPAA